MKFHGFFQDFSGFFQDFQIFSLFFLPKIFFFFFFFGRRGFFFSKKKKKKKDLSRPVFFGLKIADILGFFTGVVHDFDQRFIKTRPFRQIDPTTQWTDSENANASVFAYFHGFSIRERKSG